MPLLVIDASIAAAWLFPDEETAQSNRVLELATSVMDVVAPTIWAYEIRNTLLIGRRRGRLSADDVRQRLKLLDDLDIDQVAQDSMDRVYALAEKYQLTIYDAAYLELALDREAPLATLDSALRRAAVAAGVSLLD